MRAVSPNMAPDEIEADRSDSVAVEVQVLKKAVSSRLGIHIFASEDNTAGIYIRYRAGGPNVAYLTAGQVWIDPLQWQGTVYWAPKSGTQAATTTALK